MRCGICGSEEGTAGCPTKWKHASGQTAFPVTFVSAPPSTFVDGERYWMERALRAEATLSALTPSPEKAQESGEGGPCECCGTPFMAKAEDFVWEGNGHDVGVATCPYCQYPALAKLDPAPPQPEPRQRCSHPNWVECDVSCRPAPPQPAPPTGAQEVPADGGEACPKCKGARTRSCGVVNDTHGCHTCHGSGLSPEPSVSYGAGGGPRPHCKKCGRVFPDRVQSCPECFYLVACETCGGSGNVAPPGALWADCLACGGSGRAK